MFTIADLDLLIEAVGTLIAEYGERPERVEMLERLRSDRERLRVERDRYW